MPRYYGERSDERYIAPLAEHLPADLLYSNMRRLHARKGASNWYRSAFATVEFALCREAPLDPTLRADLIDQAGYLLRKPMGLMGGKAHDVLRLNAAFLCSYLPAFLKRSAQEPLNEQDCANLYKSVATAMTMTLDTTQSPEGLIAHLAEGIMFCLSARTRQPQNIIWPASPREESSPSQPSNHDGYVILNGGKLRAQTKLIPTAAEYEQPTIVVVFEEIAQHVARKIQQRYAEPITSYDVPSFVDIIFREATGEALDPEEKYQLDVATAHLLRPLHAIRQQDKSQNEPHGLVFDVA